MKIEIDIEKIGEGKVLEIAKVGQEQYVMHEMEPRQYNNEEVSKQLIDRIQRIKNTKTNKDFLKISHTVINDLGAKIDSTEKEEKLKREG